MKTSKVLSITRKADRAKMAEILTEQLQAAGAKVTRDIDLESIDKRSIYLKIVTERSLAVTVHFNGDSPHSDPNTFVLSWHFAELRSNERISEAFAPRAVNELYRHKATHVCYGFDALLALLLRCIAMAQDGTAFDEPAKPEPIKSIALDTAILPYVIADSVVSEVEKWSGAELEARSVLVHTLNERAENMYLMNPQFRRWMHKKGNEGRDTLYAFMRHWLTAQVGWFVNGKRLPASFANGAELKGRAQ